MTNTLTSPQEPGGGPAAIDLACTRPAARVRATERTATIGLRFGLPPAGAVETIVHSTGVSLGPGRIVALLGPSGSGKTTALAEIERRLPGGCMVHRVSFPEDIAVIDRIAPWATLAEALSLSAACGLSEARLWVRPFAALSEGERFRARLARAIALHARDKVTAPLLCDEFCAPLHRRAAKAVSFCLRKLVTRRRLCLVVGVSHEDVLADLQPDAVIRLAGAGRCAIEAPTVRMSKPFSARSGLTIEPGQRRDYDAFAAMHYRAGEALGFVDRIFVMSERRSRQPLGIVVYAHPSLELRLRNEATGGMFSRNPRLLNASMRVLRRLVIHPDVRGCGLGHYLVRRTMPLLGTEFVECLASMGEFNPVFEKAGMRRIGQYEPSPDRDAAVEELRSLNVDPLGPAFVTAAAQQPRVRRIVSRVVRGWYARTTGGGESRVRRQSPEFLAQTSRGLIGSRPVYYLWRRATRKETIDESGSAGV